MEVALKELAQAVREMLVPATAVMHGDWQRAEELEKMTRKHSALLEGGRILADKEIRARCIVAADAAREWLKEYQQAFDAPELPNARQRAIDRARFFAVCLKGLEIEFPQLH